MVVSEMYFRQTAHDMDPALRDGELIDSPDHDLATAVEIPPMQQRQLLHLLCHGPYRVLAAENPLELHADGEGSRAVAILKQLAVLVLANVQASNPLSADRHQRRKRATRHAWNVHIDHSSACALWLYSDVFILYPFEV